MRLFPAPGMPMTRTTSASSAGRRRLRRAGRGSPNARASSARSAASRWRVAARAPERLVVVRAERDLDGRDRRELERLVQLEPVDVREPDVPYEAFVCEPGQRAHRGAPRSPRVGHMDEVEVDREAVESSEARFAVGANRLRTAVGDPAATGP